MNANTRVVASPVCSTCNDTHAMDLNGSVVMCTRCPVPCQFCRAGGNGPFCEETPCGCPCHPRAKADSVSDHQIRVMRKAAHDARDWQTVSLCTQALWEPLSKSDRMFLLEPYRTQALKGEAMRIEARARCASIINERDGR